MKQFVALIQALERVENPLDRVPILVDYFRVAEPSDAAWALKLLLNGQSKRIINGQVLTEIALEASGLPRWLFDECLKTSGDLAETAALIVPDEIMTRQVSFSLSQWMSERILPLAKLGVIERSESVRMSWSMLVGNERFLFNKIITGGLRPAASKASAVEVLARLRSIPPYAIAYRLVDDWSPSPEAFDQLLSEDTEDTRLCEPYELAPLEVHRESLDALGEITEWQVEWKHDGLRVQLICREGDCFIWTQSHELVTQHFPEIAGKFQYLPDGTILDGEIIAFSDETPYGLRFLGQAAIKRRLDRIPSRSTEKDLPSVAFIAHDILELVGKDVRAETLAERRHTLECWGQEYGRQDPIDGVIGINSSLAITAKLTCSKWEELNLRLVEARGIGAIGVMLRRLDSPYYPNNTASHWWIKKLDPLSIDCVLMNAERGSGLHAAVHVNYTFGVWHEGILVPVATVAGGISENEFGFVETFIKENTLERFGPVRTVKPGLVFEVAFEGVDVAPRRKAGVVLKEPSIQRLRRGIAPEEAATLEFVRALTVK